MPHFTEDWFTRHVPHWRGLLFDRLRWSPTVPRRVIEIGSFEGRSTIWLLDNLLLHPDSRIVCIDTFEGGAEHRPGQVDGLYQRFRSNLDESPHAAKAEILRTHSAEALIALSARREQADLLYVDGSHEAPDVLADLVLGFRLVAPGGVVICDDYVWTREPLEHADVLGSPKLAIDAFTNIHRRHIEFLDIGSMWQVAFRKRAD
jgi:predicted O-methyltransferase YrrM